MIETIAGIIQYAILTLCVYGIYLAILIVSLKIETYSELLKKSITLPLTPFRYLISNLTPLTPLQKEIREEERTIKQLEAQKADMERLEALKRKREALFEEVETKQVERVEDHSDERVRVTVDGYQIPHTFTSKESADNYVERFHPKAKEIEMRGRFTL